MSKIIDILLRSVMGLILGVAALLSSIITAPVLFIFWVIRFLDSIIR